jgi:hypothetical protein
MKAKLTRKDDTVIELEGTAAELAPFLEPPKPQVTVGPAHEPSVTAPNIGRLIDELMRGQRQEQPWTLTPYVYNDMCPMGGPHDYPTVWMSVSPPACSKCGRSSGPALGTTIVSTQTISGELVENGTRYATSTTLPPLPFISAFTLVGAESQS